MLKRISIAVYWLLITNPGFAQGLSTLLHDPHIPWIAEVEQDWILDIPSDTNSTLLEYNEAHILQWIQTPALNYVFPSEFARSSILAAMESGDLPVFRDAACTRPVRYPELVPRDTGYSCEDGSPFSIDNPYEAADIYFFRVHQRVYYNSQKGTFGTSSVSVAPIIKKRDVEGNFMSFEPLCWFIADHKEIHNVSSKPYITLAIQTWSSSGPNFLNMKTSPLLKKSTPDLNPCRELLKLLYSDLPERTKGKFYSDSWFEPEPLSLEQGRKVIAWGDTLEVFDYKSYEEKTIIKSYNLLQEDIEELRLVQNWYWDDRKKKLSIYLKAVAPMWKVFGEDGEFRYKRPLFYRLGEKG